MLSNGDHELNPSEADDVPVPPADDKELDDEESADEEWVDEESAEEESSDKANWPLQGTIVHYYVSSRHLALASRKFRSLLYRVKW